MIKKLIALSVLLFAAAIVNAGDVKITDDGKKLVFEIGGKPFSNYFYNDGDGLPYTRPFFSPVQMADGKALTSDQYKLQLPKAYSKMEHPHHRSVWVGQGELNDADHWALKADGSNPKQRHIGFPKMLEDGFVQQLEWENKAHNPILRETRTVKIMVYPDGSRAIDLKSEYTAIEDVEFGDTKEAGMVSVRVVEALSKDENIALSTGAKGEKACWGKAAKWSDIAGTIDGKPLGVAILDHPGNPKAPSRWHIRKYGLNGANIFGISHFENNAKKGTKSTAGAVKLEKDKAITFHYRVIFHPSSTADAKLDEKWDEFAK